MAGGILLNGSKINNHLNNKNNVKFINKDQNGISDFNRAYKASDGWLYIYKNSDDLQELYTIFNSLFNEKIQSVKNLFLSLLLDPTSIITKRTFVIVKNLLIF